MVLVAAALVLAACGKKAATSSGSSGSQSPSASVTVQAKVVSGLGTVLIGPSGNTLYLLTADSHNKVTCTGSCAAAWPPLTLGSGMSKAVAGSGVQASMLGTVKDPSGKMQVTYNGFPLYFFSGDSGPGKAAGQGIKSFGGVWYVVSPAGKAVTTSSGSSSSSGSSGYSY